MFCYCSFSVKKKKKPKSVSLNHLNNLNSYEQRGPLNFLTNLQTNMFRLNALLKLFLETHFTLFLCVYLLLRKIDIYTVYFLLL